MLVLRSIISTCELAEAMMTLIFTSVERALGDSESILTKALNAASSTPEIDAQTRETIDDITRRMELVRR